MLKLWIASNVDKKLYKNYWKLEKMVVVQILLNIIDHEYDGVVCKSKTKWCYHGTDSNNGNVEKQPL